MGLFSRGNKTGKTVHLYEINTGKLVPCARPDWKKCPDHPPTRFTDNPTKVKAKGKLMGSEFIPIEEDAISMSLEDYNKATEGFELTEEEYNHLADVVGTDPDQYVLKKENRDELLADRKKREQVKPAKKEKVTDSQPTEEEFAYMADVLGVNPDTYWEKHKDEFLANRNR